MEDNYLVETKVSKSNNNKGKSFTYSTVIPKPIVTKFRLDKGHKLYWDIDGNKITIIPELPETKSIEAGFEILNDILVNGFTKNYTQHSKKIIETLKLNLTNEAKVDELTHYYNTLDKPSKYEFKKVLTYFLDYPLNKENQYEILNKVYDEITKD